MRTAGIVLLILGLIGCVIMGTSNIVRWLDYKTNCGDYLKLAGDAPNIDRASEYMGKAVGWVELRGLTTGNSAYLFRTPKNDLGIWYRQLKGGQETLAKIIEREKANPGSVAQLEKDNALMKLREVVLDAGEHGVSVTTPQNITIVPNQWVFLIGWIVAVILGAIGALFISIDN